MSLIDLFIVAAFLCSTLYIGLRSSKNIKTFKDYAIGNRRFSDFVIFCTLAASCIGGTSTMGCVGKTYAVGVGQIIVQLGVPFALLLVALVLAQRFSNYYGCCSLGDMFYQAYGKPGKVLAGITGSAYEVISSGIQFMGMGTTLNILTGIPYVPCLLISAGIIFIYTGKGGVRAVTFTDVLQFIVLIIAIPLLLVIVLGKIGGIHQLFETLPISHSTVSGETLHRYLFLALPFMLPTLSPIYVQRFLMSRNRTQGSKACFRVSLVYLFIAFMAVLLGLCARVLLPNLLKADKALVTLVGQYLPVGMYGFVVAGILAVLMSTVDSQLNSGSIMFVNDVIVPLSGKNISDEMKLRMSRWSAWIIGIAAIVFASYSTSIFEVKVIGKSLWLSVILVPLYFLLFNLKISVRGLLFSAFVGLGTIVLWNANIKPVTKIDGLFPGLFANFILVLLFYFLGGGKKVLSKQELELIQQNEEVEPQGKFDENKFRFKSNVFLGFCLVFIQMVPLIFHSGVITPFKAFLVMVNGTMAVLLIFGTSLTFFKEKRFFTSFKLLVLLLCLPLTSVYKSLEELITDCLKSLGFRNPKFEIALTIKQELDNRGLSSVVFNFASDAALPCLPLGNVASSGELSRVLLALKSVLNDVQSVPILVFDEIDANVGGEIGQKVGCLLKRLGQNAQVFCVTHLPQVASQSDHHFYVTKSVKDQIPTIQFEALKEAESRHAGTSRD